MRTRFCPGGAAIGALVVLLLICCSSTAAFGSKLRGSRSSPKTRRLNAAEEALFTEGRTGGLGVQELATVPVPKEGVASGPVDIPEDRKQKGESNTAVKVSNKDGGEAAKKAKGEDYTSEDITEAGKDKVSSPEAVSYDDSSTPEATSYDDSTPEATSYDDPQAESSLDVPESSTDDAKGAGKGSGAAKGKTVVSESDAVLKESDLEPPVAKDDKGDKAEKEGKEDKEEKEAKEEKDGKAEKGDAEEPGKSTRWFLLLWRKKSVWGLRVA